MWYGELVEATLHLMPDVAHPFPQVADQPRVPHEQVQHACRQVLRPSKVEAMKDVRADVRNCQAQTGPE
eukprot:10845331-Lingulodinium_polyedra.AAC.1